MRAATGLGFREVLELEQVAARALGIWGLYLMATALGLPFGARRMLVASICALGASIAGPQVLTFEYEPTPRGFRRSAAHVRRGPGGAPAALGARASPPALRVPLSPAHRAAVLAAAAWRWLWWPGRAATRRQRLCALAPLAAAALVLLVASRLQAGRRPGAVGPSQRQRRSSCSASARRTCGSRPGRGR